MSSALLLIMGPLIGGLLAFFSSKIYERQLKLFLSFAGAYLLSVTLTQLIPEVFQEFNAYKGLFVLSGFLFQVFLERYSEGIEHGHMHIHHHLKKKVIPLGIFVSLSFHSFTEGIPIGALLSSEESAFALIVGIFLHEIPASFTMMTIFKGLNLPSKTLITLLVIYAFMAPAGVISSQFIGNHIPEVLFDYLMAFIIGTFLHISTTILFESSEHHGFPTGKLVAILVGILLAIGVGYLAAH